MRYRFVHKKRYMTALKNVFRMDTFRPGQEEAVRALLSGRDLMCIFPTGAGKSLCFQLPAVMASQPTLVISPLIALMRDQVQHLNVRGIPAVCLDSQQAEDEFQQNLAAIAGGKAPLIYVSPERLKSRRFYDVISIHPPWLVVVDEAHCIVSWGSEFRPAYSEISQFIRQLRNRPVICAMTATADIRMQREICFNLGMRLPKQVQLPLVRTNLTFSVVTTLDHRQAILNACRKETGKVLIFCRRRAETERLAGWLRSLGISAEHYHAGMTREDRMAAQNRFALGQTSVLASTSAFGMGVDIPDIRLVIHETLADNMIDLIQQSGRAGRDGQPSGVIVLFDPLDVEQMRRHSVRSVFEAGKDRKRKSSALADISEKQRVLDWCLNGRCLTVGMARVFGQRAKPCGICSACLRAAKTGRFTRLAPTPSLRARPSELRYWVLGWERRSLIREAHLPRIGFSHLSLLRTVHSGTLHVGRSWDGKPKQRLQRLLEHMTAASLYE